MPRFITLYMLNRFPSNSCNRLASADKSGQVVIWDISHETPDINHGTDDTVNGCLSGTFILSSHPGKRHVISSADAGNPLSVHFEAATAEIQGVHPV